MIHVQLRVPLERLEKNIRIRYLSAIDQFCYELSNDFLEPTEIVDCHGEFLEGSHKTMAGYGTKMGSTILEPNLDQGPQDLYPLTREPDGFS